MREADAAPAVGEDELPAASLRAPRFERVELGTEAPLLKAVEAVERLPAFAATRTALIDLLDTPQTARTRMVATIEGDPALTLTVLRLANRRESARVAVASVAQALELVDLDALRAAVLELPTFAFLPPARSLEASVERLRLHSLATQGIAEDLRRRLGVTAADELAVAALLHDIGKIPLLLTHERYRELILLPATAEQRTALERRRFGLDHALAGGLVIRRLGLPERLASVVERHHASDARAEAAIVRLADMLANYARGRPVDRSELLAAAAAVGLDRDAIADVLASLPNVAGARRPSATSALVSPRQREVLRALAEGKVYRDIARELGVSPSTVRTHLHHLYGKIGVSDRAQAVLLAAREGWI